MAKTNARSEQTRSALMDATLRVAAAQGIAAVSYRRVVTEAGMSLGTASYHFDDFDDLMLESFAHFVKRIAKGYKKAFKHVQSDDDLVEAVLSVTSSMSKSEEDTTLILTLYSEASRNPKYRNIVQAWSKEVKDQISHLTDEHLATKVELIWDGAMLQRAVFDRGLTDQELRDFIRETITNHKRALPQ